MFLKSWFLNSRNILLKILNNIRLNISFVPTLLAFLFLMLAFVILYLENRGASKYLLDLSPYLVINNADTARSILTTLIGGMISLTVFSFSMVMVVLNQASSNLTPRLVPGLISRKSNQIVLGVYIGSIVYSIVMVMNILPERDGAAVPGLGVFIAIAMGINCVGLFVYFINSITKSVQVGQILSIIAGEVQDHLALRRQTDGVQHVSPDMLVSDEWFDIKSLNTGYVGELAVDSILALADKTDNYFMITTTKGGFITKGAAIAKTLKPLDEDDRKLLHSCIPIGQVEHNSDNYLEGIKKIVEVITKAMSPGINDPGTALNGIDHLSDVLHDRMDLADYRQLRTEDNKARVVIDNFRFSELLYMICLPIRTYAKADTVVMMRLLLMLRNLALAPSVEENYRISVLQQIDIVWHDARSAIQNPADRERLYQIIDLIHHHQAALMKQSNISFPAP